MSVHYYTILDTISTKSNESLLFKKTSKIHLVKRKIQRILRIREILKSAQRAEKLQKFSLICFIANPSASVPVDNSTSLISLLITLLNESWNLFLMIGGSILEFCLKYATHCVDAVINYIKFNPWWPFYLATVFCTFYMFNKIVKGFKKKLRWY